MRRLPALSVLLSMLAWGENWPQWRGPSGTGVSGEKVLPTEWSRDQNIAWRAKLAGLGVSSPVVWGDRVFVTYQMGAGALRQGNHPTFIQDGNPVAAGETPLGGARPGQLDEKISFAAAAFRTTDGRQLWEYKIDASGKLPEVHEKRNLATSSAVTDGERVYVWFSNGQLAALDMNGKPVWTRHLGQEYSPFDLDWGHASSPALIGDRLILVCYQGSAAFLLALDKRTGKELWKAERDRSLKSYSTPLAIETPQGPEVIVNSTESMEAFDPATGKSRWKYIEPTRFALPMPVYHDGILYVSRGYRSGPYWALKAGARGEIEKSKLLWHVETGAPYTSSMVYDGGLLYMATEMGIVTCVDAKTGERVWRERLGGIYSASPVAAAGKVYLFSETGEALVLRSGRTPEVLARNKLDMRVIASPAISGGRIFVRGDRELVAIQTASRMITRIVLPLLFASVVAAQNWPSFRGPGASGVADHQNLPAAWNVAKGTQVAWKVPVPGLAHSSPIVWGDRIFLTTAVSSKPDAGFKRGLYGEGDASDDQSVQRWKVLCLNGKTGAVMWERVAYRGAPKEKRHMKATYNNATPATDGEVVVAFFGSQGIYAYDLNGNPLWSRDLGRLDVGAYDLPEYEWGTASSPILYRDLMILQCDQQKGSFLTALDRKTGKTVWRTERDELPSWGTPTIYPGKTRDELVTNGSNFIRGYDPSSGKELWRLGGSSKITAPTPIYAGELMLVASGRRPEAPIFAIRADGSVAWQKTQRGPYMPTPLYYRGLLYVLGNAGIFDCYDFQTGREIYRERIPHQGSGFSASPVASDGKLYLSSEDGDIFVVQAGERFKLLAKNSMDDPIMATPAISAGTLIVRTQHQLWGIRAK